MAVVQGLGKDDMESFSSTAHNLLLYLHTARRVFSGDIGYQFFAEIDIEYHDFQLLLVLFHWQ